VPIGWLDLTRQQSTSRVNLYVPKSKLLLDQHLLLRQEGKSENRQMQEMMQVEQRQMYLVVGLKAQQ